ncbi:hypothetical protein SAMN06265365_12832 [Tistlia consotensis]|uniref:Glycosyl transferases group 1 n=1 Tax=Tistlia consotensis USBA 355 TaxID=560819 RepID=A0A1Y6CK36_9PROT|nr:hypothetical protein [Tistlia consotensis]SMF71547.1 hypothetical protein SAMN05428998_13050 [Tistlia consotensis USBA 355]SNS06430.1 hypothetical protein SAMN06265365_12832 [Tistlia consotensis]
MTAVHLCLFNNPLAGVTDQVFFLEAALRNRGFAVSLSDRLRADALNLVIENYRPAAEGCNFHEAVGAFCRRFDKRVGVVMTEHIERRGREILFDGTPLEDPGYIGNKLSRFFGLLSQSQHAFGFFTLGPLPELETFGDIFLQHDLYRLPFPALDLPPPRREEPPARPLRRRSAYDFVFTGAMTPYRADLLAGLNRRFRVLVSSQVAEPKRAELYGQADVALNIPQDPSWSWISPMRVMFGLRMGRPTINVGGSLQRGEFDRAIPMDLEAEAALADPAGLYARQKEGYLRLAREGERRFPEQAFRLWAQVEGLDPAGHRTGAASPAAAPR